MMPDFDRYQVQAWQAARYADRGENLAYAALGLAGEAGEVANEVKKAIRDDDAIITPERREALMDELGDVLWYVAAAATELGVELSAIAERNLRKTQAPRD